LFGQTYILPATTQSRTLQYQQQQKLNVQLKPQPHLGQNQPTGSKSTSNIIHSSGHDEIGARSASGSFHQGLRPESGKKRTSFLMHTQNNQYQGSATVSGKLPSGTLQSISQSQFGNEV